jgi:hypothetical protein
LHEEKQVSVRGKLSSLFACDLYFILSLFLPLLDTHTHTPVCISGKAMVVVHVPQGVRTNTTPICQGVALHQFSSISEVFSSVKLGMT